jgi:membrane protein implicated in regulation of membrane protease activity
MVEKGNGWLNHPLVRGMLVFSAFRAVYGIGILVVTYGLATNDAAPWWTSLIFLAFSMVFSRWLFRRLKQRWPSLFDSRNGIQEGKVDQTTP